MQRRPAGRKRQPKAEALPPAGRRIERFIACVTSSRLKLDSLHFRESTAYRDARDHGCAAPNAASALRALHITRQVPPLGIASTARSLR